MSRRQPTPESLPTDPAENPASPAIERAVLATVASYPDAAALAVADLGRIWSHCFTQPDTQAAAAAARRLLAAQRPADWVNLREELLRVGEDADAIIEDLRPHAESLQVLSDRCAVLRDAVALRRLVAFADLVRHRGRRSVQELAAQAHAILVEAESAGVRAVSAADGAARNWDLWLRRKASGTAVTGIPLPWEPLSEATMGLQPGKITIVGARPSHGKTALACNICEWAADLGYPVLVFSHEMDADDLLLRIAAARAAVDYTAVLSGGLRHLATVERWRAANAEVGRLPITICDDVNLPPAQYQAMALALAQRHGTRERPLLVVVDYIQLEHIPGFQGGTRTDELAQISASWLAACRRGRFALLALAQLNRTADGGEPRVSQLRDSGAIEQDAHAVMLLWRAGHDDPAKPANKALLNLAKNRNGALRRAMLHFDGPSMRFSLWDSARHTERTASQEQQSRPRPAEQEDL